MPKPLTDKRRGLQNNVGKTGYFSYEKNNYILYYNSYRCNMNVRLKIIKLMEESIK